MSAENVEVFKRGVEAANRSDREAFLELLHPEVEWHTVLPMVGGDAVYRGTDGVRGFLEDVWDVLARTEYLIEFVDGKPRLIRSYLDPKKALQAAGLSE